MFPIRKHDVQKVGPTKSNLLLLRFKIVRLLELILLDFELILQYDSNTSIGYFQFFSHMIGTSSWYFSGTQNYYLAIDSCSIDSRDNVMQLTPKNMFRT